MRVSPLAAPRGERSGATTLPLHPPCQFAHSPLHTHTATRGRRVRKLAVPLSRRSWRRFSHAPPTLSAFGEPANQRHASCDAEAFLSARVSRATVAPPLRRFASARSFLRRRRSHPSILQERCSWGRPVTSACFHRRHAGRRSRVIAPHSSRQPACRPPRLTISFLRKYVRRTHRLLR